MKTKAFKITRFQILPGLLAVLSAVQGLAFGQAPGCGNPEPNKTCTDCKDGKDVVVPCAGANKFNPNNGNPSREITDLTVWGATGDYPLAFTRHASARMNTGAKWFGQGHNWRYNYQYELVESGGYMDVYLPDGDVLRYGNYDGWWWWQGRPSYSDWLAQSGDDAWFRRADATFLHFHRYAGSPAYWLLIPDITDPNGNVTTLTYDASHRLSQVTEPAGRWLRISYADIPVNQSQFNVFGYIWWNEPPPGQWSEMLVSDTNAYRYLRYYSTNTGSWESYGNVAEIEFYDKAGNKLSGTPFGNGPAWGGGNSTFDKAFDGDVNTFFDYAYPHFGFTGIDLGAGNAKAIGKVRYWPRLGFEWRMAIW